MITYSNYFEVTAFQDGTFRIDFIADHKTKEVVSTVYMVQPNAEALAKSIQEVLLASKATKN